MMSSLINDQHSLYHSDANRVKTSVEFSLVLSIARRRGSWDKWATNRSSMLLKSLDNIMKATVHDKCDSRLEVDDFTCSQIGESRPTFHCLTNINWDFFRSFTFILFHSDQISPIHLSRVQLTYNILILHWSKMDRLPGKRLDILKKIFVTSESSLCSFSH